MELRHWFFCLTTQFSSAVRGSDKTSRRKQAVTRAVLPKLLGHNIRLPVCPSPPICFPVSFFHLLFCCSLHFLCFHPSAPERRCVLESAAGLSQSNISFQLFAPLCFAAIRFIKHQSPPSQNFTHYLSSWDYSITNVLVFLSTFLYRITFILLWFFCLDWFWGFLFLCLLLLLLCCVHVLFTTVTSIRLIGFATRLLCVV